MSNQRCLSLLVLFAFVANGTSCSQPQNSVPKVSYADSNGGTNNDETFDWRLETSKGDIVIRVHPAWAPRGAARVRELTELGFYNDCYFFRAVDGFVVQFGMNGDPSLHAKWSDRNIDDDPVIESNERGFVTFASQMRPGTRSTQLFINLGNNSSLDSKGFPPIGKVIEGMDVVDNLYTGYGESPDQEQIRLYGNEYLKSKFPKLDYIKKATIENDNIKL